MATCRLDAGPSRGSCANRFRAERRPPQRPRSKGARGPTGRRRSAARSGRTSRARHRQKGEASVRATGSSTQNGSVQNWRGRLARDRFKRMRSSRPPSRRGDRSFEGGSRPMHGGRLLASSSDPWAWIRCLASSRSRTLDRLAVGHGNPGGRSRRRWRGRYLGSLSLREYGPRRLFRLN